MGIRSSPTGWRAVAVCALLVVGAFGVAGVGSTGVGDAAGDSSAAGPDPADADASASASAGPARQGANGTTTAPNGTNETTTATTDTNGTTTVTIPVVAAMGTAQNATDGTAVGAELEREGDVTDFERPTMIYEVDVLLANGTHLVADVNATDGSVRGVERARDGTGLFDEVFGSDDDVPSDQADPSSIRSAVEAVELVRNATGANATVTSVQLNDRDGQLRYVVETVSAEGVQSTVVVAADPDAGGVLTTDAGGG